MPNIKLTLAYDGTHYLGWQKTAMGPSIEGTLEEILSQILQEKVVVQAASRTDAGVHAKGQIVNFITEKKLPLSRLLISLNSLLPKDIAVLSVEEAGDNFHPTLSCLGKEYHYYLCYGTAQLPQQRFYSWHYPFLLNIEAMKCAAESLTGKHDFSAFCNFKKNSHYEHYVREVHKIEIIDLGEKRLCFKISGNNFLYKMVRNLVGTLVHVGAGKIAADAIPAILASQERPQAGVTAPAHGLCLYQVNYPPAAGTHHSSNV